MRYPEPKPKTSFIASRAASIGAPRTLKMIRLAQIARRRIGQVSSSIANAAHHVVPQKMTPWKLALYVIVLVLPGGSLAVLAMGWYENRNKRRAASSSSSKSSTPALLTAHCACPGSGGTGA
jgi:hypothetical protein